MKKLIVIAIMLGSIVMGCCPTQAQTFELADTGSVSKSKVLINIDVEGQSVAVWAISNGNHYIERVNAKGKTYLQYIGYGTTLTFNGKPVYSNKDKTEYWILGLTKNDTVKKVKLKVKEE